MVRETLMRPIVGEGATIKENGNKQPQTIVAVSPDLSIVIVQEDLARPDPLTPPYSNLWIIKPNGDGLIQKFTLRKNGAYVRAGEPLKGGQVLTLGVREKYLKYQF